MQKHNIVIWQHCEMLWFFLHVTGYLSSEENRHINDIVSEICENLLSFNEIFNIECMNINIQRIININMHVVGYKETVLSTLFWKYQGHDNQV